MVSSTITVALKLPELCMVPAVTEITAPSIVEPGGIGSANDNPVT